MKLVDTREDPLCANREPYKFSPEFVQESYEERRRKLLAPLPIFHISTPKGNSQAPNYVLALTHIEDGDY